MNRSIQDTIPNWGVSAFRAIPNRCRPPYGSSVAQEIIDGLWDISILQPNLQVVQSSLGTVFSNRLKSLEGSTNGVVVNADDIRAALAYYKETRDRVAFAMLSNTARVSVTAPSTPPHKIGGNSSTPTASHLSKSVRAGPQPSRRSSAQAQPVVRPQAKKHHTGSVRATENPSMQNQIPNWGLSAELAVPIEGRPPRLSRKLVNRLWYLSSLELHYETVKKGFFHARGARLKKHPGSGDDFQLADVSTVIDQYEVQKPTPAAGATSSSTSRVPANATSAHVHKTGGDNNPPVTTPVSNAAGAVPQQPRSSLIIPRSAVGLDYSTSISLPKQPQLAVRLPDGNSNKTPRQSQVVVGFGSKVSHNVPGQPRSLVGSDGEALNSLSGQSQSIVGSGSKGSRNISKQPRFFVGSDGEEHKGLSRQSQPAVGSGNRSSSNASIPLAATSSMNVSANALFALSDQYRLS